MVISCSRIRIIRVTCVPLEDNNFSHFTGKSCHSKIALYQIIALAVRVSCVSMLICKRRDKQLVDKKSCHKNLGFSRFLVKWKIVIASLFGSGTGLFFLTMWGCSYSEENSSFNQTSELKAAIRLMDRSFSVKLFGDPKAPIYCKNGGCSKVICSSIPESLDPGQIASDFIMQTFQMECPNTKIIEQLLFDSCIFPENNLKPDWIFANLPIQSLTFHNSPLTKIPKGSFASPIFANTKTLEIKTSKINIWKKWIFQELKNLNNLQIDENTIHEADNDLLQSVADTLEVLTLDGCLKNVEVLSNIIGVSTLSKIQIISLRRNSIKTISSEIFRATPNVVSLYLGKSNIENFEADAFLHSRSLRLLDIANNLLTSIPKKLIASVIDKSGFRIWMTGNPWNCTCDFQWIQSVIENYPGAFEDIPKCETPTKNALKYFTNAEFCDSTTTSRSSSRTTPETTEKVIVDATTKINPTTKINDDQNQSIVKFTCKNSEISIIKKFSSRKSLSIVEWEYPSRFRDFWVESLDNGNVWINLRSLDFGVTLIWFASEGVENNSLEFVNCVSDVRGPLILTNFDNDRSYTICLLEKWGKAPSPFNCLAIKTRSVIRNDVWLTNDDKIVFLSIFTSLLTIVCIISVLTSCFVIRRNPSLLKGSKRVVMVRKRSVQALVLPQGMQINERILKNSNPINPRGRKKLDPDYLIPLEICNATEFSNRGELRRKDSKASRVSSQYSGGSYVSGIEPSPIELANWRKDGSRRNYRTCLEVEDSKEPPPLPPHHPIREKVIPSLSLSIESNGDNGTMDPDFYGDVDRLELASSKIKFDDGIM